jgi:hypothetical protein
MPEPKIPALTPAAQAAKAARDAAKAQALRANLARRKEKARAQSEPQKKDDEPCP